MMARNTRLFRLGITSIEEETFICVKSFPCNEAASFCMQTNITSTLSLNRPHRPATRIQFKAIVISQIRNTNYLRVGGCLVVKGMSRSRFCLKTQEIKRVKDKRESSTRVGDRDRDGTAGKSLASSYQPPAIKKTLMLESQR